MTQKLGANRLSVIAAAFIGISLPSMVLGKAALQGSLIAGFLCILILGIQDRRLFSPLKELKDHPIAPLVAALFIFWAVSVFFSFDVWQSAQAYGRVILAVLGTTIVWSFLTSNSTAFWACLKALIATSAIATILALVDVAGWSAPLLFLKGDLWKEFPAYLKVSQVKTYASVSLCLIPPLAWGAYQLNGPWRYLALASIVATPIIMEGSGSRSSLAGLAIMIFLSVALVGYRRGRLIRYMIVAAIPAIFAIFSATLSQFRGSNQASAIPTWLIDGHRQEIWTFVFKKTLESPWIGHGLDVINMVPGANEKIPGIGYEYVPAHPHNWLLEIAAETGFVGVATLLFILLILVLRNARILIIENNKAALALAALTAGFWTSALFNFSIWSSWWHLTYLVLFAILSAAVMSPCKRSENDFAAVI